MTNITDTLFTAYKTNLRAEGGNPDVVALALECLGYENEGRQMQSLMCRITETRRQAEAEPKGSNVDPVWGFVMGGMTDRAVELWSAHKRDVDQFWTIARDVAAKLGPQFSHLNLDNVQ